MTDTSQTDAFMCDYGRNLPVAFVRFTAEGEILGRNAYFDHLFFDGQTEDLFRANARAEDVLPVLLGQGEELPSDPHELRSTYGRVDWFMRLDGQSTEIETQKGLGFYRNRPGDDEEDKQVVEQRRKARFFDRRAFRYFTEETSEPEVFESCIVDLTSSEIPRLDAERGFMSNLSEQLIHEKLYKADTYELRSNPRQGSQRASGDFFFFWTVRRKGAKGKTPFVVAMIGDAAEKNLKAAAAVQHAAFVLRSFCDRTRKLAKADNPALDILNHLNRSVIDTQVIPSEGLDGMVLVFDFENKRMFHANGQLGAFHFKRSKPDKVSEIGMRFTSKNQGNKSIGRDKNQEFHYDSLKITPGMFVFAMTDGIRNRLTDHGERRDLAIDRITEMVKNSVPAGKTRADSDDAEALGKLVDALSKLDYGGHLDDELVIAISLDRLKNVIGSEE